MRVRHLNDFEIQGLLDRRDRAQGEKVPGEIYLQDLEAQEHLDNCPTCLAEVALYRGLYSELGGSDQTYLPKNFARKVTFLLPPFRAQRTRMRLQLAAVWVLALLVSLTWFLSRLDWQGLIGESALVVLPKYVAVKTWLMATVGSISMPEFDPAGLWPPMADLLESLQTALLTDGTPANLIILAGIALLLVGSLDQLYSTSLQRRRNLR